MQSCVIAGINLHVPDNLWTLILCVKSRNILLEISREQCVIVIEEKKERRRSFTNRDERNLTR